MCPRKFKGLFPAASLLFCGSSFAQSAADKICAEVPCRPEQTVTLDIDAERYMEAPIGGTPYAYERSISLFPGDEFSVRARIEDGEIQSLSYEPDGSNGDDTIRVSFEQAKEFEDGIGMRLIVTNPFDRHLRYEAYIQTPEGEEYDYTSSCPVNPGISTVEQWPYPIIHLVMTDVRLLPIPKEGDDGTIVCE